MSFKHKAVPRYYPHVESQYVPGSTLPSRPRAAEKHRSVTWLDMSSGNDSGGGQASHLTEIGSKTRLDYSPNSVIEQARGYANLPTPSPTQSPSLPSVFSSPSIHIKGIDTSSALRDDRDAASLNMRRDNEVAASGAVAMSDGSRSNLLCSAMEGGLLALIASKFFSYRERNLNISDDKHVPEVVGTSRHPEEAARVQKKMRGRMVPDHYHRRTLSESSQGSAGEQRSLCVEFDAMLVAAVESGVGRSSDAKDRGAVEASVERGQLPEIQEDFSFSRVDEHLRVSNDGGNAESLEITAEGTSYGCKSSDSSPTPSASAMAATSLATVASFSVPRRDASLEDGHPSRRRRTETDIEIVSATPHSSSSSRRQAEAEENDIVFALPRSYPSSSRGKSVAPANERTAQAQTSSSSPSSSSNSSKENLAPNPRQLVLERVRRDKIFSRALTYHEAKNSNFYNRYNKEAAKNLALENQEKIKIIVDMEKVEMKLEEKRAKAFEKMQNEMGLAHKKTKDLKASEEAERSENKAAKAVEVANRIRMTGKIPTRCLFF